MAKTIGPHADPPSDFDARPLPIHLFRRPWFRIYRLKYGPIFFGRSGDSRFDAPAGEFGVLYAGKDERCAFIETFGHDTGARFVDQAELAAGESYDVAQRWMLAIHNHPKKPDGITYSARHDPSRVCLALFDRAADAIEVTPLGSLADPGHAVLVAMLLDTYGFGLV